MKVVCLIPSLQVGGMERVMSELIGEFAKKEKVELHLILYGKTREVFYYLPNNIIIHKPEFKFGKRLIFTLKTLLFLRQKVREVNPDTILSFGEIWNNFVLIALTGLKYPVYVSDRCQPDKNLGKMHEVLRKYLYPKASGIIAQTNVAKEIYRKKINNSNIAVIGNPVPSQIQKKEILRKKIVLSVGRLIDTKHHDDLIKMFVELKVIGWKLVIVGGDALNQRNKQKLKMLVKELHAENKVVIAGSKPNVEEYYRESKIFAFASSSEGFPNVIGEAMVAGLPVVAFDCVAGPSEMITNGEDGYLINLFDWNNFKIKLKELMQNDDLRNNLSNKAIKNIEKFDKVRIAEQYFKFINDRL